MTKKHPIRLGLASLLIERGPSDFGRIFEGLETMYPNERVINPKEVAEHIQSLLAVGFVTSEVDPEHGLETYHITDYGRAKVAKLT